MKNPIWLLPADPLSNPSKIEWVNVWTDEANPSPLFSDWSSLALKSSKALERRSPIIVV